jgi:hypothetical protein
MPKSTKKAVDYIDAGDGRYFCEACVEANGDVTLCREFRAQDIISRIGSCIKWKEGRPAFDPSQRNFEGHTPGEMKYEENPAGFGCRRCDNFDRREFKCEVVDEKGGPDFGVIMPSGCCNDWQKSPIFGIIK